MQLPVRGDAVRAYLGAAGEAFPPAGSAPEVTLEPFDRIAVFQQPHLELRREVHITGEVQYPGSYALTKKEERLSDLVKRAGDLLSTPTRTGPVSSGPWNGRGCVDIELRRILERPGGAGDVILQPSDSPHVPEYNPTVRVEGAVNSPTSVPYQEGQRLGYYIANVGGYTTMQTEVE